MTPNPFFTGFVKAMFVAIPFWGLIAWWWAR